MDVELQVVIIPSKDECFQPLERHCVPSSFAYKESRQGLSYTFEFFKQYGFDNVESCVGFEF